MKSLRFPLAALLALGSMSSGQFFAQEQVPAPAPAVAPSGKPRPAFRQVSRPPAETQASVRTRSSTAQAAAARVSAPPLTTLPAFSAIGLDGRAVAVSSAAHTGHWLLVYRRDNCVPCDQTLLALAGSSSADLKGGAAYTIVVGDASAASLASLRTKFTTLGNATWLLDSNQQAFKALKPRGAPMLYAMNGDRIEWTTVGNLGNPALVEQRAAQWLSAPADKLISPTLGHGTVAK